MKKINIEKTIYEFLGVNIFRKYVLFTWEKIAKKIHLDVGYRIQDKSIEGLKDYKIISKGWAISHLLLLCVTIPGIICPIGSPVWGIAIIANLYCIMVQRYTHIRINKILKKLQEKPSIDKIETTNFDDTKDKTEDNTKERLNQNITHSKTAPEISIVLNEKSSNIEHQKIYKLEFKPNSKRKNEFDNN